MLILLLLRHQLKHLSRSFICRILHFQLLSHFFTTTSSHSINTSFLRFVLSTDFGKTAVKRGLCAEEPVHLSVYVSSEAQMTSAGIFDDVGTSGKISFRRKVHIHDLGRNEKSGQVAVGTPQI